MDYVFAPMWIVVVVNSISGSKLEKLFLLLGKHATNMWLVYVFLFEQYLQEFIFYPRYAVLVVVNLVFCSLVCSYGIGVVSRLVYCGGGWSYEEMVLWKGRIGKGMCKRLTVIIKYFDFW